MSIPFDGFLGTIRSAFGGDQAASVRIGGWVRTIIDQQAQERLHQLLNWVERVHGRSLNRWYPIGVEQRCKVHSTRANCMALAVGMCTCCGRPVCLAHAMISADADLLCAQCFSVARQHAQPFRAEPEPSQGGDLKGAYRILRVSEDASDEEIRKAWRGLSAKYHPDRKKTDVAKVRAEIKFKEIQAAWSTISASRGVS